MTFHDYLRQMERQFQDIKEEHMLFWNLWCLQFAFDRISPGYKDYNALNDSFHLLWQINDQKAVFNTDDFAFVRDFSDNDLDTLADFKVEELAVKEFINRADIIVRGLIRSQKVYGGKATFTIPINIIEIILDQQRISVTKEEGFYHPLCIQEVTAQLKLSAELSQFKRKYDEGSKNLYRTTQQE